MAPSPAAEARSASEGGGKADEVAAATASNNAGNAPSTPPVGNDDAAAATTASTSASASASSSAFRGTILSILLRILSFLLSQLTIRSVSTEALGSACVPLELLMGTALFVGREGFRLSLTKEPAYAAGEESSAGDEKDGGDGNDEYDEARRGRRWRREQRLINASWLSVPIGALSSFVALLVHLRNCRHRRLDDNGRDHDADHDAIHDADYALAGVFYCLASLIESFAEPLAIRCLRRMEVSTKAGAEGMALLAKSAACFVCLELLAKKAWFGGTMLTIARDLGLAGAAGMTTSSGECSEAESRGEECRAAYAMGVVDDDDGGAGFAIAAFGISQLAYALTYAVIMYRSSASSSSGRAEEAAGGGMRCWPRRIPPRRRRRSTSKAAAGGAPHREGDGGKGATTANESAPDEEGSSRLARNLDLPSLRLTLIFALQSLFKHALTEADKIVLSALAGSYDQGVYALAASYGGLAARMLLQPLEENSRLLFARMAGAGAEEGRRRRADNGDGDGNGRFDSAEGEGSREEEPPWQGGERCREKIPEELESTYLSLMRGVLYVGLLFAAVATNYTSLLLRLLAGERWGSNEEAGDALSAFCVYTAFLALNGTAESFVYGVARSGSDVARLTIAHASVGMAFAFVAPGLVRERGATGLVMANCVSMGLRAGYGLRYARGYFAGGGGGGGRRGTGAGGGRGGSRVPFGILPPAPILAAFGASYVATRASRDGIYRAGIAAGRNWMVAGAGHVAVGVACVGATAALALWLERDARRAIRRLLKRKGE